jgi:hypothetical protein
MGLAGVGLILRRMDGAVSHLAMVMVERLVLVVGLGGGSSCAPLREDGSKAK